MVEPHTLGVDAQSDAARASSLIASHKVEGTAVHLGASTSIGYIRRLLVDKPSGRIAYAIVRLTGMSSQPASERAVSWQALTYNAELGAYDINSTDEQFRLGPIYPETTGDPRFDPAWEEHVHHYFNTEPYWNTEADRATDVPFGKKKTQSTERKLVLGSTAADSTQPSGLCFAREVQR
jgi:hypothetical protein